MNLYQELFENNKNWVAEKLTTDPDYFTKLSKGQSPKFLFIGCSDSRVPESLMLGAEPGEIFVHRNIANLVVNTDLNVHSVIEFAVEVLKVEHIIICGHYGCGGVMAALTNNHYGLVDKWLNNIKDTYRIYKNELEAIEDENLRLNRMIELNVIEQVHNLYKNDVIQKAWYNKANLKVHGWVFNIAKGLIKDLNVEPGKDFEFLTKIFDLNFEK